MGAVVLIVALILTVALGALYQRRNGRIRGLDAEAVSVAEPTAEELAIAELVPADDARVTLLQFSTSFCAPCRATKRILSGIAEVVPGVTHLEIDAESHLDAVRALDIRRTPTVLMLDADRRVIAKASGQPKRDEVMATLARILDGAA